MDLLDMVTERSTSFHMAAVDLGVRCAIYANPPFRFGILETSFGSDPFGIASKVTCASFHTGLRLPAV